MIIIGSGSRYWKDIKPIKKVLVAIKNEFPDFIYYHGAQRGFDTLSYMQLRLLKHKDIQAFTADWDTFGKKAGPIRNQNMLDVALLQELPKDILLIAMPLENSIGTYGMVGICKLAKIQVRVYNKEGDLING